MPTFSGGGGSFNGGTITEPLVSADTDAAAVPITVHSASDEGAATGQTLYYADTKDGVRLWDIRDDGTFLFRSGDGTASASFSSEDQTQRVVLGAGIQFVSSSVQVFSVTPTTLGFFGALPATQPANPTTLSDVIAALVALGLVHA